MLVIGAALAATPTKAQLEAHQAAVVQALRAFDHAALQALFTEKGGKANRILLTQSQEFWLDTADYHASCRHGAIEADGDGRVRVGLECLGASLKVAYVEVDGRWLRDTEGGEYSGSMELMDIQQGWTVPGRPVGALPGSEVPPVPFDIALSPVFIVRKKHMDAARFGALGTLAGGCGVVETLVKDAWGGTQWGTRTMERPYTGDETGPFVRYRTQDDGTCAVLISWAPPSGAALPFPYACQTEHCRTARGEPLTLPEPGLSVAESGAKRERLVWAPVPGASKRDTVYSTRSLELDLQKGGLARLLPSPERAYTAPRSLEYARTTRVGSDRTVEVTDSDLKVTKVDDALRESVEALEAKKTGLRWPGLRVEGGRVVSSQGFDCTAALPPSLPTEPVGIGAEWTETTVEVVVDTFHPVTRHHRLVSIDDATLGFESRVEARVLHPGALDYGCVATGRFTVDRATLAVRGDFESTVTFEGRDETPGAELSAKARVVERSTVSP
ncbi:MAG: hypothetical protein R3F61_37000 [Myxococcota bacterium]